MRRNKEVRARRQFGVGPQARISAPSSTVRALGFVAGRILSWNTSIADEASGTLRVVKTGEHGRQNGNAVMEDFSLTPVALNSGFVVAITIEAKKVESEAVASILNGLVAPTMAEPGVKLFLPYRSPSNSSLFFIFELYANERAWGAHQETKHFKDAIKELLPRVATRERVPFVPFVPFVTA